MQNAQKQKTPEEIFYEQFDKWNASLHQSFLNIEKLKTQNPHPSHEDMIKAAQPTVDCYDAKNAMLMPTVEDGPCTTPHEIGAYFAHFAEKNPVGKIVKNDKIPQIKATYDADGNPASVIARGVYIFTMDDGKGGRVDLPARFEFEVTDGKWIYHSSNASPSACDRKPTPHVDQGANASNGRTAPKHTQFKM